MDITYKSKNNIVYLCRYHVVWCSKYRRKILTNGIDTRLKELILSYAASISVDVVEVEPQLGIHRAVKLLKGYTAKILRSEYPTLKTRVPSLWTNNYFVSTMSNIPQEIINQYIENQKTSQRQKDKPG